MYVQKFKHWSMWLFMSRLLMVLLHTRPQTGQARAVCALAAAACDTSSSSSAKSMTASTWLAAVSLALISLLPSDAAEGVP